MSTLAAIVQVPRALTPAQTQICETALAVPAEEITWTLDYACEHLGTLSEVGQAVIKQPFKRVRLAEIGFPPEWCDRIICVLDALRLAACWIAQQKHPGVPRGSPQALNLQVRAAEAREVVRVLMASGTGRLIDAARIADPVGVSALVDVLTELGAFDRPQPRTMRNRRHRRAVICLPSA